MADTTVATNPISTLDLTMGLWGPYWISTSVGYIFYIDSTSDLVVYKTSNSGSSWAQEGSDIRAGSVKQLAVWYDQETPGDTGTLIHLAYLDSASNIAYYRTFDTSDDSLGTERSVATGLTVESTSQRNKVAITKTVSGNIIYAYETWTEIGALKSSDNFATAGTTIANVFEAIADGDWCLLYPAATADNDDAAAIYWDANAIEISLKMYDDSENDWTETSIDSGADIDTSHINMDAAVRHSDSHIILLFHSNDDSAGDDLRCYDINPNDIDSPTVTQKTNIFTDQGESAQVGILINQQNDYIYAAYLKGGTWQTAVDVIQHVSTNGGGTWSFAGSGSNGEYSEAAADDNRLVFGGRTVGDDGGRWQPCWYNDDFTDIFVNLTYDIEITAATPTEEFKPKIIIY